MTSNGKNFFLDIPTAKGLKIAFIAIVGFMAMGAVLYYFANKGINDYVAKVGDCFIQGALISILFAILKAMIDNAKWWRVLWPFFFSSKW
jgi:hypothetical protein